MDDSLLLEVVFCIDGTASMGSTDIKNGIRILCGMKGDSKYKLLYGINGIGALRTRIIVFRDFRSGKQERALMGSRFFNTLQETEQWFDMINFAGGGDTPENALEAFYAAMCSEWTQPTPENRRRIRQVIVIITDSVPFDPSVSVDFARKRTVDAYPKGMPSTMEGLRDLWMKGSNEIPQFSPPCARLVIVAPHTDLGRAQGVLDWYKVAEMDRTWFIPVNFDGGKMIFTDLMLSDIGEAASMIAALHPDQED